MISKIAILNVDYNSRNDPACFFLNSFFGLGNRFPEVETSNPVCPPSVGKPAGQSV
jgi:hypothetical protein